MVIHLTTPSLKIQVTGEYTVEMVKSTREISKDAVSSFQTKSSAQPPVPHSVPPKNSPRKPEVGVPILEQPPDQPHGVRAHLPMLLLPWQGWGSPQKHQGPSQSLVRRRRCSPCGDTTEGAELCPHVIHRPGTASQGAQGMRPHLCDPPPAHPVGKGAGTAPVAAKRCHATM